MRRLLLAVLILVLAIVVTQAPDHTGHDHALAAPARQAAPSGDWVATFGNVSISEPTPLGSDPSLDVFVHSRDKSTWTNLEAMTGVDAPHHGDACEAPPATHESSPHRYEDAVFLCGADAHVMTAIKAGGYGLIYMTPGSQLDFSAGEATVRFDLSTLSTAPGRDWIDVWVTPFEDNLVGPFDIGNVDLQGGPKNAIQARMSVYNGKTTFRIRRWMVNSAGSHVPVDLGSNWAQAIEDRLAKLGTDPATGLPYGPSAKRRDTFELTLSTTHIKFRMLSPKDGSTLITWIDRVDFDPNTAGDQALPWNKGVVQFGHHSYNPHKTCTDAGRDGDLCPANTWHWDNLTLNPAVPFTMIRAHERAVIEGALGSPMTFTFPQPAPADAFLRVDAYGAGYEVSEDNGSTWATLTKQAQDENTGTAGLQFSRYHHGSYWHPITAGVQSVQFRTTEWGGWGQGGVDYAAIWAEDVPVPATPTPVATPTEAPTETPTPLPTWTPTSIPTFTPVPPTNTPLPTWTPVPTATPGPAGITIVGSFASSATSGTNASVTHGADIQANDVIVCVVNVNNAPTVSDNNGSTPFTSAYTIGYNTNSARHYIFWRRAGSSEPASYAFTLSASNRWSVTCLVLRGVTTSGDPWDVTPAGATDFTGTSAAPTANSMTTSTTGAMALAIAVCDCNSSNGIVVSTHAGDGYTLAHSVSEMAASVNYKPIVGAAPVSQGGLTFGLTASAGWLTHQFAVKP